MISGLKGWKTVLLNVIVGSPIVIAEILSYTTTVNWNEFLPPHTAKLVIIGLAVGNIIMRSVTTTPIGQKEPKFKDTTEKG